MAASQKARGYRPSKEHLTMMVRRRRETVGWVVSPEARANMSKAAKMKASPSAATREKLRQANIRREYRPVRRDDGEVFRSLAEAGRAHGISNAAICNAIKRGRPSAGHRWEYV